MKSHLNQLSTPDYSIISSKDGKAIIEYDGGKILSYLDENGEIFKFNGEPLFVKQVIVGKKVGIATIINKNTFNFGAEQPWTEDDQLNIIWENNEPKRIQNKDGKDFLFFINPYSSENKIILGNDNCSYELQYPLETIDEDVYLSDKNDDFVIGLNISNGEKSIYLNNNGNYEKVVFHSTALNNSFHNNFDIPTKDTLNVLDGVLVAYNEEENFFYEVDLGDGLEYGEAEFYRGNVFLSKVVENGKDVFDIYFSPSLSNPKEPETLDINGKRFFLVHENSSNEENNKKFQSTHTIQIKGMAYSLDINNKKLVKGIEFYNIQGNTDSEGLFTDGENIYNFKIDEKGEFIYENIDGEKYPVIFKYAFHNKTEEVLLIKDGIQRAISTIKIGTNNEGEDEYGEILFDDEQKQFNIISINKKHGIVCLAKDMNNTSRYRFYRINNDGTLTYVFTNNYEIQIGDDGVVLSELFDLVRRPNTSSILEPIIINGNEYFVAKKEGSEEYLYVSTISGQDGFEEELTHLHNNDDGTDINNETFLPTNSFQFDGETFYFSHDGELNVLGNHYFLSDIHGKITNNVEDAIIEVGGTKILILRGRGEVELFGYFEGLEKMLSIQEIGFYEKKDHNFHNYSSDENESKIKTITVGGKEYILKCTFAQNNILEIIELTETGFVEKNINGAKSESGEFLGEEFVCNGETIFVSEIVSDIYVKGDNGEYYYRSALGKDLEKVDLPKNISIGNGAYCNPNNYSSHVSLKLFNTSFETIEIGNKKLYLTEIEEDVYLINGKPINIHTFFNSETNELESYEKQGDEFTKMTIGGSDKVLLLDSMDMHIKSVDGEDLYFNIPKEGLIDASVSNDDSKCCLIDYRKGKKFSLGVNCETGEVFMYAYTNIGEAYYAIHTLKEGYNIEQKEGGHFFVNGQEYNQEMLDFLHEELVKNTKNTHKDNIIGLMVQTINNTLQKK